MINHTSPVPYYFQLSSFVEERVRVKDWTPGQLLPSEQDICARLGVSRTVVRQAMAELERKGLIAKQNGKRSSIALPKYQGGLMQNLRGFYDDAVASGQKPSTKVLGVRVVPASPEVAEALRLSEHEPTIELNRLRFLDDEPEVLVVTYLPESKCPGLIDEDLTSQSLYAVLQTKYRLRIVEGFRTIEAIPLDRSDARLLGVRTGSPALLLKSVGLIADGTPLEYFIAKHRGDRARFDVRLVSDTR